MLIERFVRVTPNELQFECRRLIWQEPLIWPFWGDDPPVFGCRVLQRTTTNCTVGFLELKPKARAASFCRLIGGLDGWLVHNRSNKLGLQRFGVTLIGFFRCEQWWSQSYAPENTNVFRNMTLTIDEVAKMTDIVHVADLEFSMISDPRKTDLQRLVFLHLFLERLALLSVASIMLHIIYCR